MLEHKLLLQIGLLILVDTHVYTAIHRVTRKYSRFVRYSIRGGMWVLTAIAIVALVWYATAEPLYKWVSIRQWVMTGVIIIYASKVFTALFILIDDIQIGVRRFLKLFKNKGRERLSGKAITRSEFLAKTALAAGAIPFTSMVFGIMSGATDYYVRRRTVYLPKLPASFDGMRIGHISDIHSGTFFNKTAVKGGVEMLMKEKADVVFFTGDLVNYKTDEVNDYIDVFDKVAAPLGVFSVTGNHDYGNYFTWSSEEAKKQNFRDMLTAHRQMGYDLLMNEHRFLEFGGERIAIIGIENWGMGPPARFPKYGKLDVAYKGTEEAPVKLLLSHDPSHWDAQVRPEYPDIDIMFAGHTHGFQMGVEFGDFKWSPSQYMYKQWAGLYRKGDQYIYVNRGYGCIGYPGRIGMPPEITIIELKRGSNVDTLIS